MALTKVQTAAGNTGAVAGTTVAGTLAATQFNSTLLAFIMCAVAGAVITPPAGQGWTQVGNTLVTNPAGGSMACFISPYNPGGITTVTFTITSSLASILLYEISGAPGQALLYDTYTGFSNNNAASGGVGAKVIQELGEFCIGVVGYVNNTAITVTTYPQGFVEDVNSITTNAAGNAGIRAASLPFSQASPVNFGGLVLSGAPANGPDSMLITLFGYLLEPGTTGPYPYLG